MSAREESYPMSTVTLELPDDVFSALRRTPEQFESELRLAAAIHWHEGAEAFGVDFDDLDRELRQGSEPVADHA